MYETSLVHEVTSDFSSCKRVLKVRSSGTNEYYSIYKYLRYDMYDMILYKRICLQAYRVFELVNTGSTLVPEYQTRIFVSDDEICIVDEKMYTYLL